MLFRIVSSLILLPLFITLIFWKNPIVFQAFTVLALCLGWFEYRGMMNKKGSQVSLWLGLPFLAVYLFLSLNLSFSNGALIDTGYFNREMVIALFVVAVCTRHIVLGDLDNGLRKTLIEIMGPVYLGCLGAYTLRLHQLENGAWWIIVIFFFAWMYDAGAYFIGKFFGRRPFNGFSPSKTWEGFWGGIVVCVVFSMLIIPRFMPLEVLTGWTLVWVSISAAVLAQIGDLFESMLKRYCGVKDSGNLLGQHGGILDKVDSTLFVAPLLYWVAIFVGGL